MTTVGQDRRRNEATAALSAVTFCSWHPVIIMEYVDRFVDRAIGANSAIRAAGPAEQRMSREEIRTRLGLCRVYRWELEGPVAAGARVTEEPRPAGSFRYGSPDWPQLSIGRCRVM